MNNRPEPQPDTPKPEVKKATEPTANDDMSWKIAMGLIEDAVQKQPVAPQPSSEDAAP